MGQLVRAIDADGGPAIIDVSARAEEMRGAGVDLFLTPRKLAEDDEYVLFSVTLFRRVKDEFAQKAREKKYVHCRVRSPRSLLTPAQFAQIHRARFHVRRGRDRAAAERRREPAD